MKTIIVDDIKEITKNKATVRHGGCAKIFVNQDITNQQKCYKVYHSAFNKSKRSVVLNNCLKQSSKENILKKVSLVIPDTLYLDNDNKLLATRMKNYPYGNLMNAKNNYFYSKEYNILVTNFMKGVKKVKGQGIVLTDLKESNILIKPDLKPLFIDNDFTFLENDEELIQNKKYLSNVFGKAYLNTFGDNNITQNFNDFVGLYIVVKLLIENSDIDELIDYKGRFTVKSLLSMQRFIQTDKSLSTYLRKVFKNLVIGNDEPVINNDVIEEVDAYLLYKYKKRL